MRLIVSRTRWPVAALAAWLCFPLWAAEDSRLIIKFRSDPDVRQTAAQSDRVAQAISQRTGLLLRRIRQTADGAGVYRVPVADAFSSPLESLQDDPAVEYAIEDRRMHLQFVPNDPQFFDQWHLVEDAGGIFMAAAWDLARGASTVRIGIVDSGILPHSDLAAGRFLPGYDFIESLNIANDGDGRDPDETDPGDATVDDECGPGEPGFDSSWHGTHLTGIIAATADNNLGVAGVDHRARIIMARAVGKCGGFLSDIIDGTRWLAGLSVAGVPDNTRPVNVVNLSLGGFSFCTPFEQNAIDEVVAEGTSVVVAAGNEGGDVAALSPANCDNVITVAATTRSGSRAPYTNTGEEVDISAPGGAGFDGILSTSNTGLDGPVSDTFLELIGTSLATAQVTGVIALMLAVNPDLEPDQVEQVLKDSARDFPDASCTNTTCGAGILDAASAIALALVTPGADVPGDADGGGGGGGGGCSLAGSPRNDPLFVLVVLWAALAVWRRREEG